MGHVISSTMKDAQRELQTEMQEKQLNLMIRTQERMKRMQVAQMVAMSRERFYWMGSLYGLLLAGATAYVTKNKHLPPPLGVPIIVGGTFLAYQWDLCWGTKLERINKMAEQIAQEEHWFNPHLPTEEETIRIRATQSAPKRNV